MYDVMGFLMSYYILALNAFFSVLFMLFYLNLDPFNLIRLVIWQKVGLLNIPTKLVLLMLLNLYFLMMSKFMFLTVYIKALMINHIRNYCETLHHLASTLSDILLLKYYFRILIFLRNVEPLASGLMFYFIFLVNFF